MKNRNFILCTSLLILILSAVSIISLASAYAVTTPPTPVAPPPTGKACLEWTIIESPQLPEYVNSTFTEVRYTYKIAPGVYMHNGVVADCVGTGEPCYLSAVSQLVGNEWVFITSSRSSNPPAGVPWIIGNGQLNATYGWNGSISGTWWSIYTGESTTGPFGTFFFSGTMTSVQCPE